MISLNYLYQYRLIRAIVSRESVCALAIGPTTTTTVAQNTIPGFLRSGSSSAISLFADVRESSPCYARHRHNAERDVPHAEYRVRREPYEQRCGHRKKYGCPSPSPEFGSCLLAHADFLPAERRGREWRVACRGLSGCRGEAFSSSRMYNRGMDEKREPPSLSVVIWAIIAACAGFFLSTIMFHGDLALIAGSLATLTVATIKIHAALKKRR